MKQIILIVLIFTFMHTAAFSATEQIGTTFSIYQCEYLGLDWKQTYLRTLEMGWDLIRIGADWERIETAEGMFDFSDLDWQLALAEEKGVPVILALGMKTPRWPEFHIPGWLLQKSKSSKKSDISNDLLLRERTLSYLKAVISRYSGNENIKYWQVENEALNRFGEGYKHIGVDFLNEEVNLVRKLDKRNRPVILTAATYPNKFLKLFSFLTVRHDPVKEVLRSCDIIGFNIYPTVGQKFLGFRLYYRTTKKERLKYFTELQERVRSAGKESWIVELQAEPWEPGKLVYLDKDIPKTGRPESIINDFREFREYGFDTILLWGVEYWLYREKAHNDPSYIDAVSTVLAQSDNS